MSFFPGNSINHSIYVSLFDRGDEPPDSFYEFGPDDFAAVMKGYSKSKAEAEKGLRTSKMREQEEQEKANRFPHATIRIEFPDGTLLQVRHGLICKR